MQPEILYIKLEKNVETAREDICLKDLGSVFCENESILNRCKTLKICKLSKKKTREVISVMKVIQIITDAFPKIRIENIGETDVVIEHINRRKKNNRTEWLKIVFVSGISFFGTAFTIMAFHNDIQIEELFSNVHRMITGVPSTGYSILEISYSIGLSIGIIVFFNHIGGKRISKDPTPIEVEMRIYEDEVNQTLIDYADRMETEVDAK